MMHPKTDQPRFLELRSPKAIPSVGRVYAEHLIFLLSFAQLISWLLSVIYESNVLSRSGHLPEVMNLGRANQLAKRAPQNRLEMH